MTRPNNEELDFLSSCKIADIDSFIEKCMIYQDYLYKTNETFNLTRIPESDFFSKHVCDSLSIAREIDVFEETKRMKLCDIGCGAGIPSLFLAAAFPNLYVTAIDARGKKVRFVDQSAALMGLTNLRAIHGRASELAAMPNLMKHSFALATARAVSDAATLIYEAEKLLSRGGKLVIYRTPSQAAEEIPMLERANMKFTLTPEITLPGDAGTRLFLVIG